MELVSECSDVEGSLARRQSNHFAELKSPEEPLGFLRLTQLIGFAARECVHLAVGEMPLTT